MRRRQFIGLIGGAAAAWPVAARAQQKSMPVIGYLDLSRRGPVGETLPAAFRQGLSETGYAEGQNFSVEYRSAEGDYNRLAALAADLVERKVDLIVAGSGSRSARAAKDATSTIPVLFTSSSDPVGEGLVPNLARPGGNVTGLSLMAAELTRKRFDLLSELVRRDTVIALLMNPTNPNYERIVAAVQESARIKGVRLLVETASDASEIDIAFAKFVQLHAGAIVVDSDAMFTTRTDQLVALASRHGLPAIYLWREQARTGGLMSYGPSNAAIYRQAGVYAGQILKGTKPADLPIQQPTKFEFVINLKTAKALDVTIAPSLLATADEVIE